MPRAADTIQKMRQELLNDPAARGYAGRSPAEQAALMNQRISKSPKEFITFPGVLTPEYIWTVLKSKFPLLFSNADNPPATQQEVLESRAERLGFGVVEQGDMEQARVV